MHAATASQWLFVIYTENHGLAIDANWPSSPEFYIVTKKVQGWTKAYSNTCSIMHISWTKS